MEKRNEITIRGIILGVLITLVFTAAQVYLGLKVGLTFATSIPAAVISMALLSAFKNATIQENNIVQTIASAAGTLSSVVFVLPGLMMIGWWSHVPFWQTFLICAIGGTLGVMYSMPLRRALVTQSDLPYPEGVAAAEVLKVGTQSRDGGAEGQAGLWAIIWGTVISALYAAGVFVKFIVEEITAYTKFGKGVTGLGGGASLALVGAGHLMGITVGIAMFTGLAIAWGLGVPWMTTLCPMGVADHTANFFGYNFTCPAPGATIEAHATVVWKKVIRLMGAGTIGAAAMITLMGLAKPVVGGLISALEASRRAKIDGAAIDRTEQDLPIFIVGLVTLLLLVPAGWLLSGFLQGGVLASVAMPLIAVGVAYILVVGLLAAAVCGYMAGLIGASNSPVSGIAILTVLGAALSVGFVARGLVGPDVARALIAYALLVTTVVLAVAVIGNDNLQDLKTGQLVDATPWKQQVALVIGVVAGAAVIPPVLEILNHTNGFVGAANIGVLTDKPLPAPQANLLSTLARGVIEGKLDWGLLGIGAGVGVLLVAIDAGLKGLSNGRYSLPALGVGLAIYLPSAVTAPVVVGAIIGWVYEKMVSKHSWGETAKRLAVLVSSGFIVGESLFNVLKSAVIYFTNNPNPIVIPNAPSEAQAQWIAIAAGIGATVLLFGRQAAKAKAVGGDDHAAS